MVANEEALRTAVDAGCERGDLRRPTRAGSVGAEPQAQAAAGRRVYARRVPPAPRAGESFIAARAASGTNAFSVSARPLCERGGLGAVALLARARTRGRGRCANNAGLCPIRLPRPRVSPLRTPWPRSSASVWPDASPLLPVERYGSTGSRPIMP